jgi:hypothetical protein
LNRHRSKRAKRRNQYWGRDQFNLPSWQGSDPSAESKAPDYSDLAIISPAKKNNKLSKLFPNKYLTTPWVYLLRSRIASVLKNQRKSQ